MPLRASVRICPGAVLTFLLSLLIALPASGSTVEADLPDGLEEAWWSRVQQDIEAREYHIRWRDETLIEAARGAYQAPNRAHNFRIYFADEGLFVVPRAAETEAVWHWGLTLRSYGHDGAAEAVGRARRHVEDNRIEYRRPGLIEWYINDQRGLEQGFTLLRPPAVGGPEPETLVLSFELEGDLAAEIAADGRAVSFGARGHGAATLLHFGGLAAWDATGRPLPIVFALAGDDRMQMRLHAADAVYPITVDPLLTSPAWSTESNQANAQFGYAVAAAGDVNGDGFSDVIVGAPLFDMGFADEGATFVYHGGGTGLSMTPDWMVTGGQAGAQFGFAVATAGDADGDGFSDVIVGAPLYNNGLSAEGAGFVFRGSAGGLSTVPAWMVSGGQANAQFGYAVATAGDVNGDGFSDIVVGAPFFGGQGRAFVYHGSIGGLATTAAWFTESGQAGAQYGYSVATAGDVNGDGYSDVIVGAPLYAGGGRAYVYHGSATGLLTTAAWITTSGQAGSQYGISVATAGDVNGDGFSDVIVGAPLFNNTGRAYVYHGAGGGLSAIAAWIVTGATTGAQFGHSVSTAGDVNGDGYADVIVGAPGGTTAQGFAHAYHGGLTGLSTTASWSVNINQAGAQFGWSVTTAGDVNGDGFSDVIVGARRYTNGQAQEGGAFVYYGSPDSLSTSAEWVVQMNQSGANYGWSVATAGDVNGDGYSDVIVGAPGFNNVGAAFVYLGSPNGLSTTASWMALGPAANSLFGYSVGTAGDVNGDGYADVIVGAPDGNAQGFAFVYHGSPTGLSTTPAWVVNSGQAGARFGWSVGMAGDVNGDGYTDVIVGAPRLSSGLTDQGRAYVYYGSPGGLSTTPDWTFDGGQAGAQFGFSVATAGDVNRDGYSDVIIGAPYFSTAGSNKEGRAFVFHGSQYGLSTAVDWTVASDQGNSEFGYSVASAGDIDGDGYSEVVIGAPLYDNNQPNQGAAFVYYGGVGGLSTIYGNQVNQQFGISAVTAGDVNGDGYSDLIVGAHRYSGPQGQRPNSGAAFVFLGSPAGLITTPAWQTEGNLQVNARFGFSVSSAGDVNGDGYADVIVGAPMSSPPNNAGAAFVYYGNGGGLSLRPQMRRHDDSAPIVTGTSTYGQAQFRIAALARSPMGRGQVGIEWEVKQLGTVFDGTGTGQGAKVATGGTLGTTPINQLIGGLVLTQKYHWRMRLRYDPATSPFQQTGRWLSPIENAWEEMDFRTFDDSNPPAVLTVITTTVPDGVVGEAYNQQLHAQGGIQPYTWEVVAGALPPGLTLDPNGEIDGGTPTTAGTYQFTVQVTDVTLTTATQMLSITVVPALEITTTALPDGIAGVAYSYVLTSTGGYPPYAWDVIGGALPPGLVLDAGGEISGTPTQAGTFGFTVEVTDAMMMTDTRPLSITIVAPVTVATTALPSGINGKSYSYMLVANGGFPPYSWAVIAGSLPPGMILSSAGLIFGTPTTTGLYTFTVEVTDTYPMTDSRELTLEVVDPPPPTTAVDLISFTAEVTNGTVVLRWQTGVEIANAGFRVLRSDGDGAPGAPIHGESLIPARGGIATGMSYELIDADAALVAGDTVYYTLADVETTGRQTLHGPLRVELIEGYAARYEPAMPVSVLQSMRVTTSRGGTGSIDWAWLLLAAIAALGGGRRGPWRIMLRR